MNHLDEDFQRRKYWLTDALMDAIKENPSEGTDTKLETLVRHGLPGINKIRKPRWREPVLTDWRYAVAEMQGPIDGQLYWQLVEDHGLEGEQKKGDSFDIRQDLYFDEGPNLQRHNLVVASVIQGKSSHQLRINAWPNGRSGYKVSDEVMNILLDYTDRKYHSTTTSSG